MRFIITLALVLVFSTSFCQWTKVQQLPSSDIFTLYHKGSVLYAGGKNIVYISRDKGLTWDSTSIIPQSFEVDNIIIYKNELYVASYSIGIFKSVNDGNTWQNINAGIDPFVSDFCEFKGNLYAATLGSSVFKLDSVNRNNWSSFDNGLSSLSANATTIAGNSNALIAGTLGNGLYDYLPPNSTTWEERFLLGQINPVEDTYDIINSHDSLFLTGSTGRFYISTDDGATWNTFSTTLPSNFTSLVNARQALLFSRVTVTNAINTSFYYIKKDSLQNPFVNFSFVPDHFTYKTDILADKLWDASNKGLFFMSLSGLPGISAADDSLPIVLPVHFIAFEARCDEHKVLLTWKTAQEQNSRHFNIERSADGINWTVIDYLPAAGNSTTERSYSITDNDPLQNGFYRIVEYDLDTTPQYSNITRSTCGAMDEVFRLWPNPVHDKLFINIVTTGASQAVIKVFDSKGALVKTQKATFLQGSNQFSIDVQLLAKGEYTLSVYWNNGLSQKIVKVVKQ